VDGAAAEEVSRMVRDMKTDDIEQIIKAEQMLARAHLSLDLSVLDTLFHKDYKIVQPGGRIETKQDVLISYQTGNRNWDKAEVSELEVEIFGEMARVIGLWSAVGLNNGEAFNYQARFISIWIKEDSLWKNIAYSSAALEE
jgi:hypothetical protein